MEQCTCISTPEPAGTRPRALSWKFTHGLCSVLVGYIVFM